MDFGGRGRLLAIVFGIGTDGGGGLATLLYSFVTALSWRAPFLLSGGFFLVVGALCAGDASKIISIRSYRPHAPYNLSFRF